MLSTAFSMPTAPLSPPPLPRLSSDKIARVMGFLQTRYDIRRPPLASAQLLVLVYELWKTNTPWPQRRLVAEHIGMNIYALDGALSVATARGLISLSIETVEGGVQRRESVIKLRRYAPSPELVAAIER